MQGTNYLVARVISMTTKGSFLARRKIGCCYLIIIRGAAKAVFGSVSNGMRLSCCSKKFDLSSCFFLCNKWWCWKKEQLPPLIMSWLEFIIPWKILNFDVLVIFFKRKFCRIYRQLNYVLWVIFMSSCNIFVFL